MKTSGMRIVGKFETTEYAQMRRCRMAHLRGEMIDERFSHNADSALVSGYVHAIRPDLTCWPMRWSIIVEAQPVRARSSDTDTIENRPYEMVG
jgi:hypothetical protein